MNKYVIITDSCVDLTQELADELELVVLPLTCTINGKDYYNYLDGREISSKAFYELLANKNRSTTSQINSARFKEEMEKYLIQGYDILEISFSSALSGTYASAVIAGDELKELYPNNKIICIDSLCASMGQGLLLTYAAKMKKNGSSIDEVAKWCEDNKQNICHLFTVGDLNFLRRGGRLSYTKALIGTILHVKPLLHVNQAGKLVQTDKTRGRKSSLDMMIEQMKQTIVEPNNQIIYISHGDCLHEAKYVEEKIREAFPTISDVVINYVGPVIGSHSGLGTLAIFYLGNERFR